MKLNLFCHLSKKNFKELLKICKKKYVEINIKSRYLSLQGGITLTAFKRLKMVYN